MSVQIIYWWHFFIHCIHWLLIDSLPFIINKPQLTFEKMSSLRQMLVLWFFCENEMLRVLHREEVFLRELENGLLTRLRWHILPILQCSVRADYLAWWSLVRGVFVPLLSRLCLLALAWAFVVVRCGGLRWSDLFRCILFELDNERVDFVNLSIKGFLPLV